MKHVVIFLISIYQKAISPFLPFNQCRFYPSCSHYSKEAVEKWGVVKGLWLGTKRIAKCHPFSKYSGYDPVP